MAWHVPSGEEELAALLAEGREGGVATTGRAEGTGLDPAVGERLGAEGIEVVSTAGLDGVAAYRPRELVVTARAGLRLPRLREVLAEEGQWLPPAEWSLPGCGSAGGLVAGAPVSPFDAAFGPVRRQLLGCRILSPEGEVFRWGRPLMKNVAGYDLRALCCGSRGRLGVLVEVSFRTWPRPAADASFRLEGEPGGLALADALARTRPDEDWFAPDACVWSLAPGGPPEGTLAVRLLGSRESLEGRRRRLQRWAEAHGARAVPVPPGSEAGPQGVPDERRAPPAAAAGSAGAVGEALPAGPAARPTLDGVIVALTTRPRELAELARRAREALGGATVALEAYPLQGFLRCAYRRPPEAGGALAAAFLKAAAGARAAVERGGEEEHALAAGRRPPEVAKMEEAVVAALGGGPREWIADYV